MSVNFKNIGGVVREANESSCLECGFHLPIREWKSERGERSWAWLGS